MEQDDRSRPAEIPLGMRARLRWECQACLSRRDLSLMAALHDMPADTREPVICYCCGCSIQAAEVVRFEEHPRDGVCISCAAWLHKQSLPIVHTIHRPFWRRLTPRRFDGG
jgi:hypothetical protein